jgi:hypothetical protein
MWGDVFLLNHTFNSFQLSLVLPDPSIESSWLQCAMSHTHTNNNSIGQRISISVTQSVHLPYTQHTCNNMLLIWWPEGKLWSEQGEC